jgi:hypothetical protein
MCGVTCCAEARRRWFDGVPEEKRTDLILCGWFALGRPDLGD